MRLGIFWSFNFIQITTIFVDKYRWKKKNIYETVSKTVHVTTPDACWVWGRTPPSAQVDVQRLTGRIVSNRALSVLGCSDRGTERERQNDQKTEQEKQRHTRWDPRRSSWALREGLVLFLHLEIVFVFFSPSYSLSYKEAEGKKLPIYSARFWHKLQISATKFPALVKHFFNGFREGQVRWLWVQNVAARAFNSSCLFYTCLKILANFSRSFLNR